MKFYEYETKNILKHYSVPSPRGEVVTSAYEAQTITAKLQLPAAVKAQVLVAGRGKAGGIQFAKMQKDAVDSTKKLLSTKIKGIQVGKVLIEEKVQVKKELYFGVTVDHVRRCYVAIASATGGTEIEEAAAKTPQDIFRVFINPLQGFHSFQAKQLARKLGYSGNQLLTLSQMFEKLYRVGMDYDAELIETNPLVETATGEFVVADARLIVDDNALFRHPEYQTMQLTEPRELSTQEFRALKNGLTYVALDGSIGVVGNGAGLVMATIDLIHYYGGEPANFLDLGGDAPTQKIAVALRLVDSNPNTKVTFINILGGITRCDDVARAIIQTRTKPTEGLGVSAEATKPLVVRLVGTNEQEAKHMLTQAGIAVFDSMEQAAQQAVQTAKGRDKRGD